MWHSPGHAGAGNFRRSAQIAADRTRAEVAQELPRVDAVLVAVVPRESDCVLADTCGFYWLRSRFEHRQHARLCMFWLSGFTIFAHPLVITQCARTRVAKVLEAVMALVSVLPLDVHARPGSQLHFDRLRGGLLEGGHVSSIAYREHGFGHPRAHTCSSSADGGASIIQSLC